MHPEQVRARVRLPVVGAKPVEGHVQLDDVSAKQHKVPNLWTSREEESQEACGLSPCPVAITLPASHPGTWWPKQRPRSPHPQAQHNSLTCSFCSLTKYAQSREPERSPSPITRFWV